MELAIELEAGFRELASAESLGIPRKRWQRCAARRVRGEPQKPLLLWSEQYNLTGVLAITDHSDQRLALAVARFGRVEPGRLAFVRTDFMRSARPLARSFPCEQFPDDTPPSQVLTRVVTSVQDHSCHQ